MSQLVMVKSPKIAKRYLAKVREVLNRGDIVPSSRVAWCIVLMRQLLDDGYDDESKAACELIDAFIHGHGLIFAEDPAGFQVLNPKLMESLHDDYEDLDEDQKISPPDPNEKKKLEPSSEIDLYG